MKYSLTIHDLSASQVTDLMNRVNGEATITSVQSNTVLPFNTTPEAANAEAKRVLETSRQNVVAANTSTTDVDALMTASTNELLKSTNTGERDSAGLPWDERIHSGSKKKNADGKWKLRKNVDENLVKQVEAENAGGELPAFLRTGVPAAAQSATVPPTVPATSVVNATAPAAAPMPPAPAAAIAQPAIKRDFSGLMLKISNLFATKQIAPDYPNTIVQRVNAGFQTNIATLTDVANDPRMVEYSWQCLEVDGKAA